MFIDEIYLSGYTGPKLVYFPSTVGYLQKFTRIDYYISVRHSSWQRCITHKIKTRGIEKNLPFYIYFFGRPKMAHEWDYLSVGTEKRYILILILILLLIDGPACWELSCGPMNCCCELIDWLACWELSRSPINWSEPTAWLVCCELSCGPMNCCCELIDWLASWELICGSKNCCEPAGLEAAIFWMLTELTA